tara:strand:+ start:5420 stop:7660 length:2241 start_codon:yes stop_codon:yes gene_type:complete
MGIASSLIKPIAKSIIKKVDDIAPKVIGETLEEAAPVATKSISGVVNTPEATKSSFIAPRLDRTADLGIEPPLIAEAGKDAFEALGMTAEKKDAWRSVNKKSQRSKLLPEIEDAAQQLSENKITSEQFRQISKDKQPIVALDKVPDMPAYEDISGALTDSQVKKGIVGLNLKIPAGERVSSRLDIPAYNDYDTWVVSLHDGSKKSGAAVAYAKTAVLRNVEFVSDPKVALDIARRKSLASGGRMGKATIARIFGDWVPHNPDNAKTFAEKIFKDPEWTQVGMNPYRASYFYDKADGLPVTFADEVVQIGPLVMAKNVKKTTPDNPMFKIDQKQPTSPTFAEGGAVAQTDTMLADGGMMEEGGAVDPVSGNDVPTGSLKEEVRDDIDASLSPGEFVLPADVVRYIGLEKLMKIRDAAKEGLKRMEEVGQMGNAEEAPKADETFAENDDEFNSSIDEIMSEVDNEEQTVKMAAGGFMSNTYTEGMKVNSAVDVRYFKHADGRVIYITYINDRPMTAIPEGFTQTDKPVEQKIGKEAEDAAAAARASAGAGGGSSGGGGIDQPIDARTAAFFDNETKEQRDDRMGKVNDFLQQVVNFAVPGVGLINAIPGFLSSPVLGAINNALNPPSSQPNYGIPVDDKGTSLSSPMGKSSYESGIGNPAESEPNYTSSQSGVGNPAEQSGYTSSNTGIGNPAESPSISSESSAGSEGYGGYGTGDTSGGFGEGQYAKGGFIKKKKNVAKSKRGLASR